MVYLCVIRSISLLSGLSLWSGLFLCYQVYLSVIRSSSLLSGVRRWPRRAFQPVGGVQRHRLLSAARRALEEALPEGASRVLRRCAGDPPAACPRRHQLVSSYIRSPHSPPPQQAPNVINQWALTSGLHTPPRSRPPTSSTSELLHPVSTLPPAAGPRHHQPVSSYISSPHSPHSRPPTSSTSELLHPVSTLPPQQAPDIINQWALTSGLHTPPAAGPRHHQPVSSYIRSPHSPPQQAPDIINQWALTSALHTPPTAGPRRHQPVSSYIRSPHSPRSRPPTSSTSELLHQLSTLPPDRALTAVVVFTSFHWSFSNNLKYLLICIPTLRPLQIDYLWAFWSND